MQVIKCITQEFYIPMQDATRTVDSMQRKG